jgi:hypothetical protein
MRVTFSLAMATVEALSLSNTIWKRREGMVTKEMLMTAQYANLVLAELTQTNGTGERVLEIVHLLAGLFVQVRWYVGEDALDPLVDRAHRHRA